ncbi:MAG: hypothetical protein AAF658_09365 [Myxococcota bacterium]
MGLASQTVSLQARLDEHSSTVRRLESGAAPQFDSQAWLSDHFGLLSETRDLFVASRKTLALSQIDSGEATAGALAALDARNVAVQVQLEAGRVLLRAARASPDLERVLGKDVVDGAASGIDIVLRPSRPQGSPV